MKLKLKKTKVLKILATVVSSAISLSSAVYSFNKETDLVVSVAGLCVNFIQLYIDLKDLNDEESE